MKPRSESAHINAFALAIDRNEPNTPTTCLAWYCIGGAVCWKVTWKPALCASSAKLDRSLERSAPPMKTS